MQTETADNVTHLGLDELSRIAKRYGVPVADVILIALNLWGVDSSHKTPRARLTLELVDEPDQTWLIIVPLNAAKSPFKLIGGELHLFRELVGRIARVDADEAVGGYFRDKGRAATLNPNGRSRCVGCAFCPNTLEAAADPRMAEERELSELLTAMAEQHPRRTLAELSEVTVSTGCFRREEAALNHLVGLRKALIDRAAHPRIGFLTSVIRTDVTLARLAKEVAPFALRLTVECVTRRDLLLKESKARLQYADMPILLERVRRADLASSYTYIVGLDPMSELRNSLEIFEPCVTDFPNFQIYQAHNSIMAGLRTPGAERLEFYLEARVEIERAFEASGLRPKPWEGYRSLWYSTFAGQRLPRA